MVCRGVLRSCHPEVFCKKAVLKNFAKFTGKQLCQSLLFKKAAIQRPSTLSKRDSGTGVSREFCEFFKNTYFYKMPLVAASAYS